MKVFLFSCFSGVSSMIIFSMIEFEKIIHAYGTGVILGMIVGAIGTCITSQDC